jgi:hypothetical protein
VWEKLAVCKQAAEKTDMERFNVRKLKKRDVNSIRLQSETSLQLWKTQRAMGSSIGHRIIFDRT